MSDSFMESFNQGLNMAHMIENNKRQQQAAQQQVMLHQMQMMKYAQELGQYNRQQQFLDSLSKPQQRTVTERENIPVLVGGKTSDIDRPELMGGTAVPYEGRDVGTAQVERQRTEQTMHPLAAEVERRLPGGVDALRAGLIKFSDIPKQEQNQEQVLKNVLAQELMQKVLRKEITLEQARAELSGKSSEPKTDFQSYRAGKIAQGWSEDKVAETWKRYQKELAVANRQVPDMEARELNREQKQDLRVQRIMKGKIGSLPVTDTLSGGTQYPTNPGTGKPFTPQEWQSEYNKVYEEVRGGGGKKRSGSKPIKEWMKYDTGVK